MHTPFIMNLIWWIATSALYYGLSYYVLVDATEAQNELDERLLLDDGAAFVCLLLLLSTVFHLHSN